MSRPRPPFVVRHTTDEEWVAAVDRRWLPRPSLLARLGRWFA
jgi:hypothetical protein